MTNKRKKVNKQNYPKKQTQPKKKPLSSNRLINNKNDNENPIKKIGNYVSIEMHKYNEDILRSNDILYLSGEQLISDVSERDFGKVQIELKELKKIKFDEAFIKIISSPNHSNKKWVTEQYDQMVMGDTIERSGTNAAIIKIHNKDKAIAVTVDSSANYCKSHPLSGGKQIVCESWRNLISVGAKPVAITNCLNFGNPENPEIMGEFAENILGIKEACEFLDYPVVSGNVSFSRNLTEKLKFLL